MSLSALYTFGTHAVVTYNAEAAKTQIWRPLVAGARPTIGRYHYAVPQDPTQLAAFYVAPAFSGPLPTGSIYTWVDAYPQIEDRPTAAFWSIPVAGATPRVPRIHAVSGQDPTQLAAQYSPPATPSLVITGKLGAYTITLPQFEERPTQEFWPNQLIGFTPRVSTVQSVQPQMVDLTLQPQWSPAALALPIIQGPTLPPWTFVPQQFDISVNGTLIVTPATFSPSIPPPPVVVVTPPTGGLLPGVPPELARGMGPYKRPGQVFGEQDPVSPFLTSREVDSAIPTASFHVEQADYTLAVLLAIAYSESS